MPFKTHNRVIEAIETELTNAIAAGVKSDSDANLTAMILKDGATCIYMKASDNDDIDHLLRFLHSKRMIVNLNLAKEILLLGADEYNVLDKYDTVESIFNVFEIPLEPVSAADIRCDSASCKLLLQRLKELGLKIKVNPLDQNLGAFVDHFKSLCDTHNVALLLKHDEYASRTTIGEPPEYFYQFNVLPEDMHKILMAESHYYAGYHYNGSILRLNEPNNLTLKNGVMCLFPAFQMENGQVLLRNAGCNITDVLATQLSFYIRGYIDPTLPITECYGHRGTPIAEKFAINSGELVQAAQKCLGITWNYEDSQEGITPISIAPEHVVVMEFAAQSIYNKLSAVTSDEFKSLHSVEVPIETYLNALIEVKKDRIQHLTKELEELKKPVEFASEYLKQSNLQSITRCKDEIRHLNHEIIPALELIIIKSSKVDDHTLGMSR